jgi:hypothetical protein
MAQVILPAGHQDRDRELAGRIARDLGLRELHVFWPGGAGRGAPAQPGTRARRLPGRDPLGLLGLLELVAGQLHKRLLR